MKKILSWLAVSALFCSMGLHAQEAKEVKETKATSWYDKIKFSGDLRGRFEYVDDDTVLVGTEVVKRYRERIRLRVGATADVYEDIKIGFRFTSGETSDPIGANQSLTSGFSKKGLNIDLAYAEYKASSASALSGLQVVGGKMSNPFYKPGNSELIWDADLTPEGLYVSYSHSIGDKFSIKGLLGGFSVEERAKAADSGLLALELLGNFKATDKLSFDLGLSYFNYGNMINNAPFYDATKGLGNSTNAAVAPSTAISYKEDFDLIKIGFEAGYQFDFAPVKFFVDYVTNSAAEGDLDSGFLFGFSIGKISGPKSWMFTYSYRNLEADATVGAFADSELAGGGTDIKGSKIAFEYAFSKNWSTGAIVLIGNKKIETTSDKVTRIQLDMNFKF
jgi:hypothetical protein